MRVFVNVQALVSLDTDQVQEAFNQEVTFDDSDPVTAAAVRSGLVALPASATSVEFDFGDITAASLLFVVAYQEVELQLDSNTAPSVPVRTTPASAPTDVLSRFQRAVQPGVVVWHGKVSSLFLTNPSNTDAASVFVGIVGNAT